MKKTLSLILSLVMLLSVFAALPFSARADVSITNMKINTGNITIGSVPNISATAYDGNGNISLPSEITSQRWTKSGSTTPMSATDKVVEGAYYDAYISIKLNGGFTLPASVNTITVNGVTLNRNTQSGYDPTQISGWPVNTFRLSGSVFLFHIRFGCVYLKADDGDLEPYGYRPVGEGAYTGVTAPVIAGKHVSKWEFSTFQGGGTINEVSNGARNLSVNIGKYLNNSRYFVNLYARYEDCTYGEGVVTTAPTATAEGVMTYTCTVCGQVKTATVPKLKTGWIKDNSTGTWYYYKADGSMATGWQKIGGKWYLFKYADGAMITGWCKSGGKWYWFNSSGAMVTGWQKISGKWYWFNSSGAMVTGWQKISGKWYYFNANGDMKTGWLKDGGKWYYLKSDGSMAVSCSLKIGGKTYKFNASGVCTNP